MNANIIHCDANHTGEPPQQTVAYTGLENFTAPRTDDAMFDLDFCDPPNSDLILEPSLIEYFEDFMNNTDHDALE